MSDRSNPTAAVGDLSGRGLIDIFVGNGNAALNRIRSYTLLNTGSGQFTQTSANVPVGPGQLLDQYTRGFFWETTLADLDGDGLPDLIVGGTPSRTLATILWNRDGVFSESDTTRLPAPAPFPNTHGEVGFRRIDVNLDGLPDLVIIGSQPKPLQGWYLQMFVNHGNREFVDETADRVPGGEASGGIEGVQTASINLQQNGIQILDFNQDGAPDFSIEFRENLVGRYTPSQPLVWLNDGTGHFSTLKVGDFVAAGRDPAPLIGKARLVATRNGYSFILVGYRGAFADGRPGRPLTVSGLLATKPYRITPPPSALRH